MNLSSLDQARTYLARVLPWPQEGEAPAFVNVHWKFVPKDGNVKKDAKGRELLPWSGRACRNVNEAVNAVQYALTQASTRDIYACLSTQRTAEERTGKGNFKYNVAVREASNAVALKSLFIDIDLKGGAHGYDTQEELVNSLGKFLVDTNMPQPSLIVSSGGGYHVYWTLARALTPTEWLPLAYALAEATKRHGLKCDTQCTVDTVRVLRIPNTFNRKTEPPRPVRLIGKGTDFDYSVERIETALAPYKTIVPSSAKTTPLVDDPKLFPLKTPIKNDDLSAGITQREFPPIDIATVLPGCEFLRDTLRTGGKDLANPLWNLTTLLATFCADGKQLAHMMARKHPGYSVDSTDDLFERKSRERDQKGLGWPSCATISGSGASQCQSCPLFGKGKSPLHLGTAVQPPTVAPVVTSPGNAPTPPPASSAIPPAITSADLPPGYTRDPQGLICRSVQDDNGLTTHIPICTYPMLAPWMQKKPWELHFTTLTNSWDEITLPCEIVGGSEMRKVLQRQLVMLHDGEAKAVTEFLVSWIEKLKGVKGGVVATTPFGWNVKSGVVEGFVFGGSVWSANAARNSPSPDSVIASQYTPTGDALPWMDVAAMITSQGRADLNAILASSFGAPLVRFANQPGLLMCAIGESGIGKTTAMRVAQAVWGNPITAMQGLSDTQNSVISKIGELRSLPLYWDELKTEEDTKKCVNIVFQLSSGKEKSRLNSSASQRAIGTWQTMMVIASNESILDYVTGATKTSTAGLYRVFEFEVTKGKKGQISPTEADRLLGRINDNYGMVGLTYAQFLGANHAKIEQEVVEFKKAIELEANLQQDERFWTATITCICMGAKYSNACGLTKIDEPALKAFMLKTLSVMRGERNVQPVDMRNAFNVSNVLAQYLNAMRTRHTLRTNKIHTMPVKPVNGSIKVVGDMSKLDGIYVQVGHDDRLLRISSTNLTEWLTEKGYSRHAFISALAEQFGSRLVQGRIGSGTGYAGAFEHLLEINMASNASAKLLLDEG